MSETDTTFVQRTKAFAGHTHVKRTALATTGGGLSLALIYMLFVAKADFSEYKRDVKEAAVEARQAAAEKSTVFWRELKTLENDLEAARRDIARLQSTTIRITN